MMRRFVTTLLMVLALAACGTEVGNGFKPNDKKEESNRTGSGTPTAGSAESPESMSGGNVDWTSFLFAPCASPFSEAVAPRYVSGAASLDAQVTENDILITLANAPLTGAPVRSGKIARATDTAFAFDIRHVAVDELLNTIATATCETVSSETTPANDGTFNVTRTLAVTYRGVTATVSWRLEGASPGIVRTMTVALPTGASHTLAAP